MSTATSAVESADTTDTQYIQYLERQLASIELKFVNLQASEHDESVSLKELLATREEVIQIQSCELRELRNGFAPARLAEMSELRKSKAALQHTLDRTALALERQKSEAAQAESVSAASLSACQSKLANQRARLEASEVKVDQAEDSMRVAAARLQDMTSQNADLEAECSRLADALSRCVGSLERLRAHSQASDAAAQGRQATSRTQEHRIAALQASMTSLAQRNEELQAALDSRSKEMSTLKAKLFDEQEERRLEAAQVARAGDMVSLFVLSLALCALESVRALARGLRSRVQPFTVVSPAGRSS
jgi:chromosome segregation ATPase